MANPSLTADALRTLISEVVAEALAKRPDTSGRSALPKADRERVDYDALCIKAFRKAGFGEVKPRVDVLTYNKWLEAGLRVKPGETSVKVRTLRLFHRSQVEPMTAAEKKTAMADLEAKRAKANGQAAPQPAPAPAKPATTRKTKPTAQPQLPV